MTLYPLPDVAARLHKSPRWLQSYLREQPFGRMAGRTRLFTESDILALIESLPCPSSSLSATAQSPGTSAELSEASLWTKAQRLLTKPSPKRSGRSASGKSSRARSAEIEPSQLP